MDRARQIAQLLLLHSEVVTHITNTDPHLSELEFRVKTDATLEIQGQPTPAHMPRGYCLPFVVNDDVVPRRESRVAKVHLKRSGKFQPSSFPAPKSLKQVYEMERLYIGSGFET